MERIRMPWPRGIELPRGPSWPPGRQSAPTNRPARPTTARIGYPPAPAPVHFEIAHEFDIPFDALELAVISPTLVDKLGAKVQELGVGIDSIRERTRSWNDGVLERVWHYPCQHSHPPVRPWLRDPRDVRVGRAERLPDESASGANGPSRPTWKPEWQRFFSSAGTYEIQPLGGGRSRRIIKGELNLQVRVVRQMAERLIVSEVKKAFEAEAATLRDMATLI